MRIQRFGNAEYAIGLNWRLIPKGQRRKINETAKEAGSDYAAMVPAGDFIAVGFTDGQKCKAPSAASVLRSLVDEADGKSIGIIEQLPSADGRAPLFWMCAVDAHGVPMPGSDVIGTEAEIIGSINNTFTMGGGYKVYSTTTLYPGAIPKTFAEIAEGVKVKSDIKNVRSSMIIVPLTVVTVLVGFGGWLLFSNHMEIRNKELRAAAQKAQGMLSEKQAKEEAQRKFEESYRTTIDGFRKSLQRPSVDVLVREWTDIIDSFPLLVDGWGLQSVTCATDGCSVSYERRVGTVNDISKSGSRYGTVSMEPPNKAQIATGSNQLPIRDMDLDRLPAGDGFINNLMSALQRYDATGMTFKIQPHGAPTAMRAPDGSMRQVPYSKGTFKLEGKYAFEFMEIAKILNIQNVVVENFTLSYGNLPERMPWSMEGYYVVK